jgi:hypothetical protein
VAGTLALVYECALHDRVCILAPLNIRYTHACVCACVCLMIVRVMGECVR